MDALNSNLAGKAALPRFSRLRFLAWFVWCDLTRPAARHTTGVIVVTVTIISALAVLVFGLFFGFTEVRFHRIRRDPLSLAIWVGDSRYDQTRVRRADLDAMREQIPQSLSDPSRFLGCFPFLEKQLEWFAFQESKEEGKDEVRIVSIWGRTMAVGDPYLSSLRLEQVGASPAASPDDPPADQPDEAGRREGVAVTWGMLHRLGVADDDPLPEKLLLRSAAGSPLEAPLLGATREPLPLGHEFVITEGLFRALMAVDPNIEAAVIHTGPVPATWPARNRLPPDVVQALEEWKVMRPLMKPSPKDPGRQVWQLSSMQSPPPLVNLWRARVGQLHELMRQAGHEASPEFLQLNPDPFGMETVATQADGPPDDYHLAGVYVANLDDLRPAADACKAEPVGLPVNEEIIQQVERAMRTSRMGQWLLLSIVGAVALVAACNMVLIQMLHSEQKIAEIGMLKAMGLNAWMLLLVYLVEATVIGVLGGGLGYGLALALGETFGPPLLAQSEDEHALAFVAWGWFTAAILGATVVVCVAATWLATRKARNTSPLLTLRAN